MKRIKLILKKKNKKCLLIDYLDNFLEKGYEHTRKYPKYIKLTAKSIKKMYSELKEKEIDRCWINWPNNYRGIPIKLIK